MKGRLIFVFLTVVAAAVAAGGGGGETNSTSIGDGGTPAVEEPDYSYSISDTGIYMSGAPVNETGNTVLTVGYLTAIKGDLKDKQGLAISGAITIALDEVSSRVILSVFVALELHDLSVLISFY